MTFIYTWILTSVAVFVLEMFITFAGKLVGNILDFSFDNALTESKIRNKLVFSIFAGIMIAIL